MKKKNKKIDYEAIALFALAKDRYKKCNEFVISLAEHYGYSEDDLGDLDLWCPVIDQVSYKDMKRIVDDFIKKNKRTSAKRCKK